MSPPKGAPVVVVGAGAAGAVIAARASEHSDLEIVLLEAGPDLPVGAPLPADVRDGTRNSIHAHDWGYRHAPTRDFDHVFPRGKVVGGSTAVNTCIAIRGEAYDFDEWGLDDWRFERCLPAFCRLERDLDFGDAPYHGHDGPLPVRRHPPSELVPWQAAFLEACETLGFPRTDDHNRPGSTGAGPHAMNKLDGVRQNVARCYLDPARARPNLRVRAGAHVRRVLFEGRRVSGVELERAGRIEVVACARVVLSAGAIATPGILLRSGVGPRDEVARLGVELVADVPAVGARLLDHPGCAVFLQPRDGVCALHHPLIQTALRFTSRALGARNDLQVQAGSLVPLPNVEVPLVSLMFQVGKTRGHGTLRFPSADPHVAPIIRSRLLEDPDDLELAFEAAELLWLLGTSAPLAELARFVLPSERGFRSRATIRDWIFAQTGSGYHPCGTVPMTTPDAVGATDSRGRVHGVEGLVVADASLFPTVPSSNTNLPTIMLGERFGEWLREGALFA
ncbi:MAG: GMC family oxidoreductase N-terminal domain-containing protein [Myxococcales bacterium]|nr:GMC family oxidoreductase N-terminal domain-containing protein [Myxococcales bacterium]